MSRERSSRHINNNRSVSKQPSCVYIYTCVRCTYIQCISLRETLHIRMPPPYESPSLSPTRGIMRACVCMYVCRERETGEDRRVVVPRTAVPRVSCPVFFFSLLSLSFVCGPFARSFPLLYILFLLSAAAAPFSREVGTVCISIYTRGMGKREREKKVFRMGSFCGLTICAPRRRRRRTFIRKELLPRFFFLF